MCGLLGAITWNLITWYYGLPSSSSHALIGGLVGAAVAAGATANWASCVDKVVIPMFALAGRRLRARLRADAGASCGSSAAPTPRKTNRGFRMAQTFSAAAMALGHGLQDAQKTMGVIFLALLTGGYVAAVRPLPLWVIIAAASAISLGTWSGGWRIMRTLGRRIIHLDPARGFAAESVAASVLYTTAYVFEAPISTTHTITSAVMGVGATKRLSAVRWGVAQLDPDRLGAHLPGRRPRRRRLLLASPPSSSPDGRPRTRRSRRLRTSAYVSTAFRHSHVLS